MITFGYALISFTGFIVLLLLGMRLIHEEHRYTTNRLFIAYIFTIALISFAEFMARLSESRDRAPVWAYLAAV